MIIATAGHVDHGKTSLVRQLTGVDTDTLAEEKARGLSINLGYAYLPREDGIALGFIDVPGHRRFINTMISGVSGIDMGLLVVAADDGPMPQTTEHLDVLGILGVEQLTVAISKTDRVESGRLDAVEDAVRVLLEARDWRDPALFRVSNEDGSGVDALKDHLLRQARQQARRAAAGGFRLSIDRAFSARGAGLVVTGTASAGSVRAGDSLLLLPAGREVRVRGLRSHDASTGQAFAGERVALNLAGRVEHDDIERGDWLVDPDRALMSTRLDVSFRLLDDASFALKHLAPVKLHVGARRIAGRLAFIGRDRRQLAPGERCLGQLILDEPASTVWGERFLLRDQAEEVVLGGGRVLDPDGPQFGKSRQVRLEWLEAMQAPTAGEALALLLERGHVVDLARFWGLRNLSITEVETPLPDGARSFEHDGGHWAVAGPLWSESAASILTEVDAWHDTKPEEPGIKLTDLKTALRKQFATPLLMAALVSQLQDGELVLQEGRLHRRGFRRRTSAAATVHWQTLRRHLERCGRQIPLRSELAAATRMPEGELSQVIREALRRGELHRLNDNRYALPADLLYFSERVVEAEQQGEELSVVGLKTRFQSGRKLTIELLEYFDSIHFTRRQGDARVIMDSDAPRERFGKQ